VTLLAEPAVAVTLPVHGQPGARRPTPGQVETLLVLPAVLWWAFPLTHATGGRAPFGLAVELLLLLVAAAATRPWRRLPRTVPLLGGALGVCAVAVCALSPTGWAGADDAAAYAAAGLALPIAAAWARTSARRATLAAAVVLAGLDQLSHALLPWWGGRDPSVRLVGTFYWHNPFAAYLLPAALLGLGLLVWRVRPVQAAGWVAAPACAAGVVLSTSRATLALLLLGWVVVGAAAVLAREGRLRRGLRWLVVSGVAVAVTYALPGPPLFTHRVSPFAASAARSTSGETLTSNGGYRLQFWREALASWAHHPLAGSGYHGLIASSHPYVPIGWARSNYAHNGYLQALTDGGVLLALPFLLGCAWLGLLAVRRCRDAIRGGQVEPAVLVAAVSLLAGLAHSAVDFDWSHASVLLEAALLGGLVVAGGGGGGGGGVLAPATRPPVWIGRAVPVLLVLAALLGAAGTAALQRTRARAEAAGLLPAGPRAAALAAASRDPLASDLPARHLLDQALAQPGTTTRAQRETALGGTRRAAAVDAPLAVERARLQLLDGDRGAARVAAARWLPLARRWPQLAIGEAALLSSLGQPGVAGSGQRSPLGQR